MKLQNFIGGDFISAVSEKTFSKYSPFDGSLLAEVSLSEPLDVVRAIQSSKKAATSFKDSSLEDRANLLKRMATAMQRQAQEISYSEALYQGLPQKFVLDYSVKPAIDILNQTAESVLNYKNQDTLLMPTGVIGVILSWNLSLRLLIEKLAPALAAGNTLVVKVSEHSPITVQLMGNILKEASVPEGVVNILQGKDDVAEIVAGHPGLHAIAAFGKTATMEAIAKAGLTTFKKLQLSGSVKNPVLILSDVDLKIQLPKILESFLLGQGQLCWNSSRFFVLESMAEEFTSLLKDFISQLQPLKSPEGQSLWTPLISTQYRDQIDKKVQEGRAEQGKFITATGALEGHGNFYRPAFMQDLSNCSTLQQDELQGPLALVSFVKYQHEMLKWANNSYLGHSAIVWGSEEKIKKVAPQLECSQVYLNQWFEGSLQSPVGLKQSSFGDLNTDWSGTFYSNVKKLTGR